MTFPLPRASMSIDLAGAYVNATNSVPMESGHYLLQAFGGPVYFGLSSVEPTSVDEMHALLNTERHSLDYFKRSVSEGWVDDEFLWLWGAEGSRLVVTAMAP